MEMLQCWGATTKPDDTADPRSNHCKLCDFKSNHSFSIRRHLQIHGEKTFTCLQCEKKFKTDAYLKIHLKTHLSNEEKPYKCDICLKSFCRKNVLDNHKRTHSPLELMYGCPDCGKAFATADYRNRHVKMVHIALRSFICTVCGKGFCNTSTLNRHLDIHSGIKKYICNLCGKAYGGSHGLKNHVREIHEEPGVKRHACTTCGKCFTRSYALTRHLVSHSGVKNYICKVCAKAYGDSRGLSNHQKQMHKADYPSDTPNPRGSSTYKKPSAKKNNTNGTEVAGELKPVVYNHNDSMNENSKMNPTGYHNENSHSKPLHFQHPAKFIEETFRNHNNNRTETTNTYQHNAGQKKITNLPNTSVAAGVDTLHDNYGYLKSIHEYKINSQAKFCQSLFEYSNGNLNHPNMACILKTPEKFYDNFKGMNGNHFAQQFGFHDIVRNLHGHQVAAGSGVPPQHPIAERMYDSFNANSHQLMHQQITTNSNKSGEHS